MGKAGDNFLADYFNLTLFSWQHFSTNIFWMNIHQTGSIPKNIHPPRLQLGLHAIYLVIKYLGPLNLVTQQCCLKLLAQPNSRWAGVVNISPFHSQERHEKLCLQLLPKYVWVHSSINEQHTQQYLKKS